MLRLVLGLSLAALCFAADIDTISPGVNTFYNQSAFEAVVGTFTTETFNGNQINTPGLTITGCHNATYPIGYTAACNQLSGSQLNSQTQFQFITQNMFTDAVGRNPVNPYSGNFGVNDFSTIFNLPESVTAVGFELDENSHLGSNFGINLGGTIIVYPFGGVEGVSDQAPGLPLDGYSYQGFVGLTSDTPFNSVEFSAFYNPGVDYTLDNFEFGDTAPEPSTVMLGLLGVGMFAVGLFRRSGSDSDRRSR